MPSGRPNVLVLYFNAVQPMRLAVEHHLDAFGRYSSSECSLFNLARPRTPQWVRRLSFDVVVLHTSLLSLRWAPEHLHLAVDRIRRLGLAPRACLAFPQDEFIHTDLLCDVLQTLGVTHVFSAAAPAEWPKIYAPMWSSTVELHQVLTGYLDDSLLDTIRRLEPEIPQRTIDLGYRAWRAAPSLGRLGRQKVEIAERFRALDGSGLTMDVSTRDSDAFLGDDWLRFLLRCRAVLGTESGASILDRTGELHDSVARYLREHPQALFEEVEAACFPGADGSLDLRVISPRHLEACATRTCQVLMRGDYSGILEPDVHYVPVEHDYGNLDEVVATVKDPERCREIAGRAHARRRRVRSVGLPAVRARHARRGDRHARTRAGGRGGPPGAAVRRVDRPARRRLAPSAPRVPLPRRAPSVRLAGTCGDPGEWRNARAGPGRGVTGGAWSATPVAGAAGRRAPARAGVDVTAAGSGTCPLAGTVVVSVTPVRVDRDSRARKIAASLSRAGAQSVLAGGEPGGADSAGAGFREISLRARERPARPVGTGGRGSAALRSLRRALDDFLLRPARRLPRADVYYLHAFYQFPGVLVRSLLHHAPIVYDAHDFYPALVVRAQAPRWQDRMERRIEAACIRRAAAVVTVSDGVAELYEREFGVRPLVVRNCHDQRLDRPVTRTVREAAGAGPDDFVVVIVGNRKHELPFATIVAAAGRVGPGVIVALVGDGYTAEDRLAVARAECGDRLRVAAGGAPVADRPVHGDGRRRRGALPSRHPHGGQLPAERPVPVAFGRVAARLRRRPADGAGRRRGRGDPGRRRRSGLDRRCDRPSGRRRRAAGSVPRRVPRACARARMGAGGGGAARRRDARPGPSGLMYGIA